MKKGIRYILLLVATLSTIATIILLFFSNAQTTNTSLESWFKIAITISVTINLSLSVTINYTSIANSFNNNYYVNDSSDIRIAIKLCYLIHTHISSMIELFDGHSKGISIEDGMNGHLNRVKECSNEVAAKLASFANDTSITVNDRRRLNFVKEYIDAVKTLESYTPFRWISVREITQTNKEMRQLLAVLKDKYLLFDNKNKNQEI